MQILSLTITRRPLQLLLYTVVLGQLCLLHHGLEHALEGEQQGCHLCLLSEHQVPLIDSNLHQPPVPFRPVYQPAGVAVFHHASVAHYYAARAPPFHSPA